MIDYMKFLWIEIAVVLFVSVFGGCANAAEYFWLTHIATPFKNVESSYPNVDDPGYAPTVLTIDDNKIIMNRNGCNVDIEKIVPFTMSRVFLYIVDDAGGDKKFESFLATKLHTNMHEWTLKYVTKVPDKNAGGPGCEILSGMIFRSENELIITNTTYFLRFAKGTKSQAPKDFPKSSSDFGG